MMSSQNRKYITYSNDTRGGPSHGHRQHAIKIWYRSRVWFRRYPRGETTDRQTHTHTDVLITILCNSSRGRSNYGFSGLTALNKDDLHRPPTTICLLKAMVKFFFISFIGFCCLYQFWWNKDDENGVRLNLSIKSLRSSSRFIVIYCKRTVHNRFSKISMATIQPTDVKLRTGDFISNSY